MAAMDSDWLRHIFDFFSRTIAFTVTILATDISLMVLQKCCYFLLAIGNLKMAAMDSDWLKHFRPLKKNHYMYWHQFFRNVPLVVLKKCLYFLLRSEIQDGHHGLWLTETFLTSSPEQLHVLPQNFPQMFLEWSWRCVVTFWCDRNPRWLPWTLIDWDIFDFFSTTSALRITKFATNCSFYGPEEVLLLFVLIGNPRRLPRTLDWLRHFPLLKKHCMDDCQTFHKCSYYGPEEVLLLLVVISKSKCPLSTLMYLDIFTLPKNHCIGDH